MRMIHKVISLLYFLKFQPQIHPTTNEMKATSMYRIRAPIRKPGLSPASIPLLEAFDLFPLDQPLLIPATTAHPGELDASQLTISNEPSHRIPTDVQFPGSFFDTQQHILL